MGYFSSYFGSYFDVASGSITEAVGASEGVAAGSATGTWIVPGVAESDGIATVEATGLALETLQGVGESSGAATADAGGESTAESVASSDGSCEASAAAEQIGGVSNEIHPSVGWGAWNDYHREKRRRKRLEDEELADRLEAELATEGLIEAAPVVIDRIIVREYVRANPPTRKIERAVNYALKARTEVAWQLAAREIARQEEDDFALLLALASVA